MGRALTSFINQEIEQLTEALVGAFHRLRVGGRIVVITFKPSEEAVVQRLLRSFEDVPQRGPLSQHCGTGLEKQRLVELYPLLAAPDENFALRRIFEPVRTSAGEIERNRRSRSAAVQVFEKVDRRHQVIHAKASQEEHQRVTAGAAFGHSYHP